MQALFLVMAGGAIGSGARYLTNVAAARVLGAAFPYGTLTVNVSGSFAMGLIAAVLAARASGNVQTIHLLATTGFLGGFTTFSAFSLDTIALWERGEHGLAALYVAVSIVVSLAALVAGLAIGRALA